MSTRAALLRAVLDDPDEDTPRLAFADLLDEEGTSPADAARAELIRSQIAHKNLHFRDPRRKELRRRHDDIVRSHVRSWLPADVFRGYDPHFYRGFVDYW